MVRAPTVDKNGLKKGAWSEEEDNKLRAYVLRYGHWNWRQLPRFAGLSRCGKSCRLRWMNYLKAGIRRGNFSQDEDEIILKLHQDLGNKWSAIAAKLPGRSDNEIKNHWHTHLKKQRVHNKQDCPSKSAVTIILESSNNKQVNETVESGPSDQVYHQPSASCSSTEVSSSTITLTSSQSFDDELERLESFWNELLFSDGIYCGNANTYSSSESVMSSNSSTVEEDFTLPFSLFCDDDINFFNNFTPNFFFD